jgi:hypothetical protein
MKYTKRRLNGSTAHGYREGGFGSEDSDGEGPASGYAEPAPEARRTRAACHSALLFSLAVRILHVNENGCGLMVAWPLYRLRPTRRPRARCSRRTPGHPPTAPPRRRRRGGRGSRGAAGWGWTLRTASATVRAIPGRLSSPSVLHNTLVLYGASVWACPALNRPKRRFPARAVHRCLEEERSSMLQAIAAHEKVGPVALSRCGAIRPL